jgi:SAM-dependent methyltransferase
MSRNAASFDPGWLRLREAADGRARATGPQAAFAARLPAASRLLDLGCGTGANLRHLAPRLGRARQHWMLVDADPTVLAALPGEMAGREGPARYDAMRLDLATGLEDLPFGDVDGVTASALLDLVSQAWLDRLVTAVARAGLPVLFTLSVDGRVAWLPEDPEDGAVLHALRADQGIDKGFGPALGPAAPEVCVRLLAAAGFEVETAAADWRLGPEDAGMLEALLGFHGDAASQAGLAAPVVAGWRARRRAALSRGALRVVIGHADIAAWPARGGMQPRPRAC